VTARADLVGRRFGRLEVVEFARSVGGRAFWLAQCDCGVRKVVRSLDLTRARGTRSCGCLRAELAPVANREWLGSDPCFVCGDAACVVLPRKLTVEGFWSRIDVRAPHSCWPWAVGARHPFGYGVVLGQRARVRIHEGAHRIAWSIATRRHVPEGLHVLHRCDNPPCCNPAHLYVGTASDNVRDCVARGRRNPARKGGWPRSAGRAALEGAS